MVAEQKNYLGSVRQAEQVYSALPNHLSWQRLTTSETTRKKFTLKEYEVHLLLNQSRDYGDDAFVTEHSIQYYREALAKVYAV